MNTPSEYMWTAEVDAPAAARGSGQWARHSTTPASYASTPIPLRHMTGDRAPALSPMRVASPFRFFLVIPTEVGTQPFFDRGGYWVPLSAE